MAAVLPDFASECKWLQGRRVSATACCSQQFPQAVPAQSSGTLGTQLCLRAWRCTCSQISELSLRRQPERAPTCSRNPLGGCHHETTAHWHSISLPCSIHVCAQKAARFSNIHCSAAVPEIRSGVSAPGRQLKVWRMCSSAVVLPLALMPAQQDFLGRLCPVRHEQDLFHCAHCP